MVFQHKKFAAGKWQELSLMEQLGNIGSEISRALHWQGKDEKFFQGAVKRALELFELTLKDSRWKGRLREIVRARELFLDAVFGKNEYKTSLKDLEQYFFYFAFAHRSGLLDYERKNC
ncbi:hypothetical protein KKA09_04295 [Patescibacteria group bacterium]|nr:hypothetical protein [Patescibacteria group bacterium]